MRPDIPWNIAGIPPEAREAARAAARREGLSVGEWMTRRILRSFSDQSHNNPAAHDAWPDNVSSFSAASEARPTRRDTEDMLAHVARSENESGEVFRRIEEQLRGVARRLEAAERSQSENNRAMTKAASEINVTAREQAQAFDQLGNSVIELAERVDRVEHLTANENMREAVKGLHLGLSRLADQIASTANHSASQISALADNLETVAGHLNQARNDADVTYRALNARVAEIDEHVRAVEQFAHANVEAVEHRIDERIDERIAELQQKTQTSQEAIAHAIADIEALRQENAESARRGAEAVSAISRLERTIAELEPHGSDPVIDQRLSGIEHSLGEFVRRFEQPDPATAAIEVELRHLAERIDAAESNQREINDELRAALSSVQSPATTVDAEPISDPMSADRHFEQVPSQEPAPAFDAPPLVEPVAAETVRPFAQEPDPFAVEEPVASVTPSDEVVPPVVTQTLSEDTDEALRGADTSLADGEPNGGPFAPEATSTSEYLGADSYLSAARRSARAAAAQVEAERAQIGGGFAWGTTAFHEPVEPTKSNAKRTYIVIGVIALVLILAIVAGVILSQRISATSPRTAGPLFEKAKPVTVASRPPTNAQPPAKDDAVSPAQSPVLDTLVVAPPKPATQTDETSPTTGSAATKPSDERAAANAAKATPAVHAAPQMSVAAPLDRLTALAMAGNAKAELVVGLKYLEGDGVAVSETDAVKWIQRAADAGLPVAQYRLGTMYERGRGVASDSAKAVHWYTLAAQAGNRKAMHNLAVAYASGTGVVKDLGEAARWFSKAAALGLSDSQFNLAVLYERGLGVPQSLLDAFKWYAIAAASGDAESKSRIEALGTQLNSQDRTAAQRAASTFRPLPLDTKANIAPQFSEIAN